MGETSPIRACTLIGQAKAGIPERQNTRPRASRAYARRTHRREACSARLKNKTSATSSKIIWSICERESSRNDDTRAAATQACSLAFRLTRYIRHSPRGPRGPCGPCGSSWPRGLSAPRRWTLWALGVSWCFFLWRPRAPQERSQSKWLSWKFSELLHDTAYGARCRICVASWRRNLLTRRPEGLTHQILVFQKVRFSIIGILLDRRACFIMIKMMRIDKK